MARKYDKLRDRIDNVEFVRLATSGSYKIKDLLNIFSITSRQFSFLCKKNKIAPAIIPDREFLQSAEYRKKISDANRGKIRSEEHKQNYRNACKKREIKNNRGSGYTQTQETKDKIKKTNIETWNSNTKPKKWLEKTLNNKEWRKKLSDAKEGWSISAESIRKQIETKTGMSIDQWNSIRKDYDIYQSKVRFWTNKSIRENFAKIENCSIKEKDWHLDHIYSISDGWKNGILPQIIGHHINLRFIPAKENMTKNKKSGLLLEELIEKFDKDIVYEKQS